MKYNSPEEIDYTPEKALAHGIQTVCDIEAHIESLDLNSDKRRDIWVREIETLKKKVAPGIKIAVCGSTGAGKSSLLNALLDNNILPTSGIGACTAVATEVSYHDKPTIIATVEYLKLSEWMSEIGILLDGLVDEQGQLNPVETCGTAWHKIHTVYPGLEAESLINMTPEEIIETRPRIVDLLKLRPDKDQKLVPPYDTIGPTDLAGFTREIAPYLESQDHNQDSKQRTSTAAGPGDTEITRWPLIRQVRIMVCAEVLRYGVTLVDLPGVGDTNLARANIAKEHMKTSDYIWIVSGVQREIITALGLSTLPELVEVESKLGSAQQAYNQWDDQLKSTIAEAEKIETQIMSLNQAPTTNLGRDWNSCIPKPKNSSSQPRTMSKTVSFGEPESHVEYRKRRRAATGFHTMKRARFNKHFDLNNNTGNLADSTRIGAGSSENREGSSMALQAGDEETKSNLNSLNTQLRLQNALVSGPRMRVHSAQHDLAELQKERDAICSIKRNEWLKPNIQGDFREGLREYGGESIPDSIVFGWKPGGLTKIIMNGHNNVFIPVFTCSSRDYMRIKAQFKDGAPRCFVDPEDTEIPQLQMWCRKLSISPRQQAARSLLEEIEELLHSVRSFAERVKGVNISDRLKLSDLWESDIHANKHADHLGFTSTDPDPKNESARTARYRRRTARRQDFFQEYTITVMAQEAQQLLPPKQLPQSHKGLAVQLRQLEPVTVECVKQMKATFREALQESCTVGSAKATSSAVKTMVGFAAKTRWNTYQAILRNKGEWKDRDWNAELVKPLSREIAIPWARIFSSDSDHFTATARIAQNCVNSMLKDLVDSAPARLTTRCDDQCELARREANLAIKNISRKIKAAVANERKVISRCLTREVRDELSPAYEAALAGPSGIGSDALRKQMIHNYVDVHSAEIFDKCTNMLFGKLDMAADSVGMVLNLAFSDLSEKVEANVSALWSILSENRDAVRRRCEIAEDIKASLTQLEFWLAAGENWEDEEESDIQM